MARPGLDALASPQGKPASPQDNDLPAPLVGGGVPTIRAGQRVAVMVLGMHRSGTSALARLLSLLGCALPQTLMPAGAENPTGHWESVRISEFNDEVLAVAGSSWDDWLPINPRLPESPVWPGLVERGRAVLREEFAESPLFVLKDPRICRLAGFWLEVLDQEGIAPAIVLPVRNPIEVARSLAARNRHDEHYGLLLWLRHVLDAEAATRGRRRAFASYDAMLNGWEGLAHRLSEELGVVWPRVSPLSAEEVAGFLAPGLRHHTASARALSANPAISPWVNGAFEVLERWVNSGENPQDYLALDAIAREFNAAAPAFARPLLAMRRAREDNERIGGERDALAAERDALARRSADAEAQAHALTWERDAQAGVAAQLQQQLDALRDEHAALVRRAGEADDTFLQRTEALARERVSALGQLASASGTLATASAEAESLRQQLHDAGNRLADARLETEGLRHQLATAQSTLRQREEEIEQLGTELASAREDAASHVEAAAGYEQELARLGGRLAESDGWVLRLAADRHANELATRKLERRLDTALAEAKSRAAEVGRLAEALERVRDQSLAHGPQPAGVDVAPGSQRHEESVAEITALTLELRAAEQLAMAEAAHSRDARTLLATVEAELVRSRREKDEATTRLEEADARLKEVGAKLDDAGAKLRSQEASLAEEGAGRLAAEQRLNERFSEIASLTSLLRQESHEAAARRHDADWLRQVHGVLARRPRWWAWMPAGWQRKRDFARLNAKGLFDADYYLAVYSDVTAAGMDPLHHYILYGHAEGRRPHARS